MSLADDALVQFILADYAVVDPLGKLNVLGGAITFVGMETQQLTLPFAVVASSWVPATYVGTTYTFSFELVDITANATVQIPGPDGQPQALRAQSPVLVQQVQVPQGAAMPPDALHLNVINMQFSNGLPLAQGHTYEWRAQIDGHTRPHWSSRFHVLGPALPPIIGGPTGPANIPGFGAFPGPELASDQDPQ